jgi:hypothetical protein
MGVILRAFNFGSFLGAVYLSLWEPVSFLARFVSVVG